MAKPDHHSLAYKMRAKPNKTYKELKQKQKARISDWMFQAVCGYYGAHGTMPEGADAEEIAAMVYHQVQSVAIWVPYEEFRQTFYAKFPRLQARITEIRTPEPAPAKENEKPKEASAPKKRDRKKKICPVCGRNMKQQFHGLLHCKCGVSWLKGTGFFERTSDMVFALERRRIGKKIKQRPVIRYRAAVEEPEVWGDM